MKRILCFFLLCQPLHLYALEYTRALWVTRWDYSAPEDIDAIMRYAAGVGFNTILFQVRGNGTVTYPSKVELQSEHFRGNNLDVLAEAIERAHAYGLQLHAWINLLPGWSGEELPTSEEQLYLKHPEWFMVDLFGRRELQGNYFFLSPTLPQVRAYLHELCRELYTNYEVDGIHFDYIRFPASTFSYDPLSVSLFAENAGAKPAERPAAWRLWRQNSIDAFLENLYDEIKFNKPWLILSAAVLSDRRAAQDIYYQDAAGWLARGHIDVIYPMLYSDENQIFRRELEDYMQNSHDRHVYPGISLTSRGVAEKLSMALESGAHGVAILSYRHIMDDPQIKAAFESVVKTVWSESATPAAMPWKIYTKDNLGPTFSQIQTIPSPLPPFTPFRIVAKISDPSGVYDDRSAPGQGIYLECDATWPPIDTVSATLSPIEKTQDWYMSDRYLPGRPADTVLHVRLYAHDDYNEGLNSPKRNAGQSDVECFPVVQSSSLFEYTGDIGPILQQPGAVTVDSRHQIWVTTGDGSLVIMDSTGKPMSFSPLSSGMNGEYKSMALTSIVGCATDAFGNMLVACNTAPPTIFRFSILGGEPLPGLSINMTIGESDTIRSFTTDDGGNVYILEKRSARWFILSPTGDDLQGMPYGDPHKTGTDIAVLGNGAMVFITDRTSDVVQCWYGAIEGSRSQYWRANDFLNSTAGLGKLYVGRDDHIFAPSRHYHYIAEYDRTGRLMGHIYGKGELFAPHALAFSPNGTILYITQVVGDGADRVKRWRRKE